MCFKNRNPGLWQVWRTSWYHPIKKMLYCRGTRKICIFSTWIRYGKFPHHDVHILLVPREYIIGPVGVRFRTSRRIFEGFWAFYMTSRHHWSSLERKIFSWFFDRKGDFLVEKVIFGASNLGFCLDFEPSGLQNELSRSSDGVVGPSGAWVK